MAFSVSIHNFPLKLLALVLHKNSLPVLYYRTQNTSADTSSGNNPLGYVRRPTDRKRMGLAEDFREDLSQGQAEETGQLPNASDLHSVALLFP